MKKMVSRLKDSSWTNKLVLIQTEKSNLKLLFCCVFYVTALYGDSSGHLKLKPTRSMGGYTVEYTFFLREVALLMWRVLPHANVPPLFRGGHHNPGIASLDRNVESRQHVAHESVRVGRV